MNGWPCCETCETSTALKVFHQLSTILSLPKPDRIKIRILQSESQADLFADQLLHLSPAAPGDGAFDVIAVDFIAFFEGVARHRCTLLLKNLTTHAASGRG